MLRVWTQAYLRANKMFVDYSEGAPTQVYSEDLFLDLGRVEACVSGPKRPHDQVALAGMKADWAACLGAPVGFKGFGIPPELV